MRPNQSRSITLISSLTDQLMEMIEVQAEQFVQERPYLLGDEKPTITVRELQEEIDEKLMATIKTLRRVLQ